MTDLQIRQANIAYRFKTPFPFDEDVLEESLLEKELFEKAWASYQFA